MFENNIVMVSVVEEELEVVLIKILDLKLWNNTHKSENNITMTILKFINMLKE